MPSRALLIQDPGALRLVLKPRPHHSFAARSRFAINATLAFWDGGAKIALAAALLALGFGLGYLRSGDLEDLLLDLLDWGTTILIPGLLVTGLVFLRNLLSASYMLERQAHDLALSRLDEMKVDYDLLVQRLEEEYPIQHDPLSGATVIGRAGGPLQVQGGHFPNGLSLSGSGHVISGVRIGPK